MEARLTKLEAQFETVIPTLATKADLESVRTDFAALRGDLRTDMEEIRADIHKRDASLSKWMLSTTLAIIGTIVLGFAGLFFNLSKASQAPTVQPQPPAPIIITVPTQPAPSNHK
jgi:hypothetical protein